MGKLMNSEYCATSSRSLASCAYSCASSCCRRCDELTSSDWHTFSFDPTYYYSVLKIAQVRVCPAALVLGCQGATLLTCVVQVACGCDGGRRHWRRFLCINMHAAAAPLCPGPPNLPISQSYLEVDVDLGAAAQRLALSVLRDGECTVCARLPDVPGRLSASHVRLCSL